MSLGAALSRKLAFPFWAWKDGSRVREYLDEVERHQFLGTAALEALQHERLRTLLDHAYRNVPYYRGVFDDLGARPHEIRNWEDFAAIPSLTRSRMRSAGEALRAQSLPPGDLAVENHTGGSTGEPVRFWLSEQRNAYARASAIRHDRWSGWALGEETAVLWGAVRDLAAAGWKPRIRNALLERTIQLDASQLDRARMEHFVAVLRKRRPKFWLTYAGVLSLFLRFLEERGIDDLRPQAIISSAEVLRPEDRERVRRQLGCEVFDRYGAREVAVIASECGRSPDHALHLNADVMRVEIEQGDENSGPGKILVTDLLSFAMPFVRYAIGDVSELSGDVCDCGRSLPLIRPIQGRSGDFIVTAEGRVVSGVALAVYLLGRLRTVEKAQIVQERRGEIRIRFVAPGAGPGEAEAELRQGCDEWIGDDTRVEFEAVEDIPVSASGKFPFTVSSLDPLETLV